MLQHVIGGMKDNKATEDLLNFTNKERPTLY